MPGPRIMAAALLCLALSPGAAPGQTATYPQPDSRQTFQSWVLECFKAPEEACQLYQRILINKGAAIAMVSTFAYSAADGAIRTQIALPLGIDLSKGAILATTSGYKTKVAVTRCTQQGCLIEGIVSDKLLDALAASTSATVTVTAPGRGRFSIPMSTKGFAEALARIRPAKPVTVTPAPAEGADPKAPLVAPLAGTGAGTGAEAGGAETPAPPDPSAKDPDKRFRPVTGND